MTSLLYRGPAKSCNFACDYCPLPKQPPDSAALGEDRACLERFTTWIASAGEPLAIFFTPAGEALVHPWYQQAIVGLSQQSHVQKVAIQTNLSCALDWLQDCHAPSVAFWATYHPEFVSRRRFIQQTRQLARHGVRFSVGVVGLRRHLDEIEALRAELSGEFYLWINADKHATPSYDATELERLAAVDPLIRYNLAAQPSQGRPCRCGQSVLSVDGDGVLRRCHFVGEPLGNIYIDGLACRSATPQPCPLPSCRCHIGYVHMPHLGLDVRFGNGILERIPQSLQT